MSTVLIRKPTRQRRRGNTARRRALVGISNPIGPSNAIGAIELKKYDTYIAGNISYNGSLASIDLPTQGTGSTNRVGNQITIRKLEVRGTISLQGTSTFDTVRIMFLVDTMGVNAPVIGDILDGTVLGSSSAVVALSNHGYAPRFKILYDKLHTISSGQGQQKMITFTLPMNLVSYFVGASTFKNALYNVLISNEGNVLNYPLVYLGIRLHFSDS